MLAYQHVSEYLQTVAHLLRTVTGAVYPCGHVPLHVIIGLHTTHVCLLGCVDKLPLSSCARLRTRVSVFAR